MGRNISPREVPSHDMAPIRWNICGSATAETIAPTVATVCILTESFFKLNVTLDMSYSFDYFFALLSRLFNSAQFTEIVVKLSSGGQSEGNSLFNKQ